LSTVSLALAAGALVGWLTRSSAHPEPGAGRQTELEETIETVPLRLKHEQLLLATVKEEAAQPNIPRIQVVRKSLELAMLYFEQQRWDDADLFFAWLAEPERDRDFRTLGNIGQAMTLAFRDQAEESSDRLQRLISAREPTFGRITGAINRNPRFLKWFVKALDHNAANLAAAQKTLPPELEALRKARPLPFRSGRPGS
jgi:hypothetical protein